MNDTVKILGICGSPRKAATEYSLKVALDAASELPGIEIELITLRAKKINFCTHCDKCLREDSIYCSLHDDDMTAEIYDKFYSADGYIIASPVYEMNITAQLAAFFNRFRSTYNLVRRNPDYFSLKVGSAIAVGGTRNGGQETTIQAIHGFYHTQGIIPVSGAMGIYSGACVWSKDQRSKGAEADEIGMNNCRRIGRKTGELALHIKRGSLNSEDWLN